MTRRILCSLILSVAGCAGAGELPSAETLMDRYVEVTGGKAAWEKVKTQTIKGSIEFAGQGVKGTMETWLSAGEQSRVTMTLDGIGLIESGTTGGTAWSNSAMQGPRILDGEERNLAIRNARVDRVPRWREIYKEVKTEAEEEVNGKPALRVSVVPSTGGKPELVWFDKESNLIARARLVTTSPMGEVSVESTFSDYREVSGVKVPFAFDQKVGPQVIKIMLSSVQINPEVAADRFILPEPVKALQKPAAE
ncbi:MAG: hypothetical protein H7039_10290 [Bryobacteraceae bacterium]|nr:hypothetical protein [Bryobacteraceae bacterium]